MIAAVAGALEVTLVDLTAAVADDLRARMAERAPWASAPATPSRHGHAVSPWPLHRRSSTRSARP